MIKRSAKHNLPSAICQNPNPQTRACCFCVRVSEISIKKRKNYFKLNICCCVLKATFYLQPLSLSARAISHENFSLFLYNTHIAYAYAHIVRETNKCVVLKKVK